MRHSQMLGLQTYERFKLLGHDAAMTSRRVTFEAHQCHPAFKAHGKFRQQWRLLFQVLRERTEELRMVAITVQLLSKGFR